MKAKVFAVSAVASFAALFLSAADNTNKKASCEGGACKIGVKCEKVCKEKQCLSKESCTNQVARKEVSKNRLANLSAEEKALMQKRWEKTRAEREAKRAAEREAREKAAAKAQGITVEELRRGREERMAKMAGMTLEEWKKLDPKARREKMIEAMRKKHAEIEKERAKKEGLSVEEYRRRRRAMRSGKQVMAPEKPRPGAVEVNSPAAGK